MTRLIFYNIEYLEGTDGRPVNYLKFWRRIFHPKKIEAKIAKALKKKHPDLVAFAEVGGNCFFEKDYFSYIKKELGMRYQTRRLKYELNGQLKPLKRIPLLAQQTNGLISKKKISNIKTIYLNEGIKRTVMQAEISFGRKITLLLVHLALSRDTRKKQINELIKIINEIKTPVILAGDFNTFYGEGEIKPLLEEAALKHEFNIHGGRIFTYPTYHPRRRLDYILTSNEIDVKNYNVLKMPFSDHLPVMIDFEVKK